MASRSLGQVDRELDALDPDHALARRGGGLARRAGASLADVDGWLAELGGPIDRVSGEVLRAQTAQAVQAAQASEDPELTFESEVDPYEVMTTLAPPPAKVADVGVDPELSFDDLFEDEPQLPLASEPLSTLTPIETLRPREHEAVERATLELDADDLAALDSLEIVLDD